MRTYFILILAIILAGAAFTYRQQAATIVQTEAESPAGTTGFAEKWVRHAQPRDLAPVQFSVNGAPQSLENWRGSYVLVNLWATWCAPCRREMPQFDALAEKMADEGLVVMALSVDRGSADKPDAFLRELGIKNLVQAHSGDQSAARALGLFGLPTTVLIDPQGRELARLQGEADWSSLAAQTAISDVMRDRPITGQ